jgi:hypothetical protein
MVLYSALKMIHGGVVHKNKRYRNLLMQNKYYMVPTVNVDGLAYIEEIYAKTGVLEAKRLNMNIGKGLGCNSTLAGVDLNRNYDFNFGQGSASSAECLESYRGKAAFSEPETQAMRNFLTKHKEEMKFVFNFHCAGKQFIIPYSGEVPNTLGQEQPQIRSIFKEIVKESRFPEGTDIGSSTENVQIRASGIAGDWITKALGIPAAEAEIGGWNEYTKTWLPKSSEFAQEVLDENLLWLEHVYEKAGNQLVIRPLGYKMSKRTEKDIKEPRFA